MNKEIHINSLQAYFDKENETTFSKRQSEIIEALRKIERGTAREIMYYLDYEDLNEVRPRLTELKQKGIIHEVGKIWEKRTPVSIYAIK